MCVHSVLVRWFKFSRPRILEWVTIPFSRGSSQPRDRTQGSCIAGGFFAISATRKSLNNTQWNTIDFLKYLFICLFIWLPRVLAVVCGTYFPDQGLNPGPLHWEHGTLATGPPGKSPHYCFWKSDTKHIGRSLWEKARVGWFERIALKHVYYHVWKRSPVQVRCMKQGTQSWCTGTTLRDVMWREVGGGFRMGDTCTPMADSCQCMAKTTTIL